MSEALADVRFGAHSELMSDIARSPKCAENGSKMHGDKTCAALALLSDAANQGVALNK